MILYAMLPLKKVAVGTYFLDTSTYYLVSRQNVWEMPFQNR